MAIHNTPLRYPGGKTTLSGFFKCVLKANALSDIHYAECYAGGAGIAFELLFLEHATHVHLNDLDRAVFAFWNAVIHHSEWLCKKIEETPLTIKEWQKQRTIHRNIDQADLRDLGFAFFFLNRTNRSGILDGGVIGGLNQRGEWKIDARFNRPELIRRIKKIASYRDRISIYNLDAADFISDHVSKFPSNTLVYLDPPYFTKGSRLYESYYREKDHEGISKVIQSKIKHYWIVSYDKVREIVKLYGRRRRVVYNLNYRAAKRCVGSEVMFFSDNLKLPKPLPQGMRIQNPSKRLKRRSPDQDLVHI